MKRALPPEEEDAMDLEEEQPTTTVVSGGGGAEAASALDVLNADMIYLLAAHLETPRDLLNFGRTCQRLYDACRVNNLWAGMIYRAAFASSAQEEGDVLRTFLTWLVAQFSDADMLAQHYLASVSEEKDADNRAWPIYVFAHRPPNPLGGRIPTLTLKRGMEAIVQHEVLNNDLFEKIRDIVYATMQQLSKTAKGLSMTCTCAVCKKHAPPVERETSGFRLVSPFDVPFPAGLLWYTVYKMCAIDAWLGESYARQQEAIVGLWETILNAYSQEIVLSVTGHPEAKPAIAASHDGGQLIARRPCAWYRPSQQSIASAEQAASGSTRNCSQCGLPMPFRSNQLIIARALNDANPMGQSGSNVYCSTGCFMDAVMSETQPYHVACGNPGCTNKLTLHEAVGMDYFTKQPLAITSKDGSTDHLPLMRMVNIVHGGGGEAAIRVPVEMRRFEVEVRQKMYDFEALVAKVKQIAAGNLRSMGTGKHMLCWSTANPERSTVDVNALRDLHNIPVEAWDRRHRIFESCYELLDASAPPWRFIGSRLPLPRVLYPTSELRRPLPAATAASLEPPYTVYCNHGCTLKTRPGPDARCLNTTCALPFNVCTATISFECFEVLYYSKQEGVKPSSRGYVCDRHCFEMYIEERQQELERVTKYLKDRKRPRVKL